MPDRFRPNNRKEESDASFYCSALYDGRIVIARLSIFQVCRCAQEFGPARGPSRREDYDSDATYSAAVY